MPEARKREAIVPAKMKIVVKELLDQRVYDLAAAAARRTARFLHYREDPYRA
jgi:hypothetical protein